MKQVSEMGLRSMGWQCAILYRVVWEVLFFTVIFQHKCEERESVSHVAMQGRGEHSRTKTMKQESS